MSVESAGGRINLDISIAQGSGLRRRWQQNLSYRHLARLCAQLAILDRAGRSSPSYCWASSPPRNLDTLPVSIGSRLTLYPCTKLCCALPPTPGPPSLHFLRLAVLPTRPASLHSAPNPFLTGPAVAPAPLEELVAPGGSTVVPSGAIRNTMTDLSPPGAGSWPPYHSPS